jgi:predicted metalloprotease
VSFNENSQIDTSQVTVEAPGSGGGLGRLGGKGMGIGGTILTIIIMIVLSQFGGGLNNLGSSLNTGSISNQGQSATQDISQRCKTGADANKDVLCRVTETVNSLNNYWTKAIAAEGVTYIQPGVDIFSGSTRSPCGEASSATGPFYCPNDQKVYLDTGFYDELTSRFGSSGGPLAQEYVLGHHIQNLTGVFDKANRSGTGATSDSVRVELMADCLAGMWARGAVNTVDKYGNTLMPPLTQPDVNDALSAASAVGDDSIQQAATGSVNSDSWTHGSSAQRMNWFSIGYNTGDYNACVKTLDTTAL